MNDRQDAHKYNIGDRVRYVPGHAFGDPEHPSCEDGIVRSFSRSGSAFVVYDNKIRGRLTTLEKAERWTAAATNLSDLVKL